MKKVIAVGFFTLAMALFGCGGDDGGGRGRYENPDQSDACNASNCRGCCFNGACQPGNTAAACGSNGDSCKECKSGDVCSTAQACVLDPESRWSVRPESASFATTEEWDFGNGAPDPFIRLWCPAGATSPSLTTQVRNDTFSPTWSDANGACVMSARELENIGIELAVYDSDISSDDIVMKGPWKLSASDFEAGSFSVSNKGSTCTAIFSLTRQR